MRTTILNILPDAPGSAAKTVLSFRPFVDYLKRRYENDSSEKSIFFKYVIESFEKHDELLHPIDVEDLKKYEQLLQLVYHMLVPIIEDEDRYYRALCLPLKPVIFYSTNAFFRLVTNIKTGDIKKEFTDKGPAAQKRGEKFAYTLILDRLFQLPSFFNSGVVQGMFDETTGLTRFFRLEMDARFIGIHYSDTLPDIKMELLKFSDRDSAEVIQFLEQHLPLQLFTFEGFGVTFLNDVTASYALENVRNIVLNNTTDEQDNKYLNIANALKTIVGNYQVEFGILPVLKVNNKLVFSEGTYLNSMLMRAASIQGVGESIYMSLGEGYLQNPKLIFFRTISSENTAQRDVLELLQSAGIVSYALIPVFFNNQISGVLEIYAKTAGVLTEAILSKLEPAIPLVAQMLKNNVDAFNNEIEKTVREKFTAVQPSVQWKFNDIAWQYLRDQQAEKKRAEPADIIFDKVFPLYGAVDIRNSTEERNGALRRDMEIQFTVLLNTLEQLKEVSGLGLIDEKIFNSRKWLRRISEPAFNQELKLNDFIENEITPFLIELAETNQELNPLLETYFKTIDDNTGDASVHRRQLEHSMNTVIGAVSNYMDSFKDEVQHAYPSYFEKFRTDGVEYDIYIGQSIAPDRPFSEMYLKNLRLLQVKSMAAIGKHTHYLKNTLAVQVDTTQLIFIHAHPIDIKFRKDEKRFDVEGSYNIRYHIIKKRIDKVRIKETKERLTQPGKIALVYFNQKEADEYKSYIRYLQGEGVLLNDLEYLDLEDLQGVNGLKALRVGIRIEAE